MTRILLGCTISILVVLGIWFWMHPKQPQMRPIRFQTSETWDLPSLQSQAVDEDLQLIKDKNLWGIENKSAATALPLTPPNWRILGVYTSDNTSFLLIQFEQKPPIQLKRGDKLPGGATILSIGPERISILLNGKHSALTVYRE